MVDSLHKLQSEMLTDTAWEEWGRRDPYFAVITNPKFRHYAIDQGAKLEFFNSGASHAEYILSFIRKHLVSNFAPKRVLDFGCGVGRVLIPFSHIANDVVGVDVSPAMLQEAKRNCADRGLQNVRLLISDDKLSTVTGAFDLIHSAIVFQHIPTARGRKILIELMQHLAPQGVAAIHLTYSKSCFAATFGIPSTEESAPAPPFCNQSDVDPEMQMNSYNITELLFILQQSGTRQVHIDFTDHGGELGVFLFFSAPAKAADRRPTDSTAADNQT